MIRDPSRIHFPQVQIRLVAAVSQLSVLIITAAPEDTVCINIIMIPCRGTVCDILLLDSKWTAYLQILRPTDIECRQIRFLRITLRRHILCGVCRISCGFRILYRHRTSLCQQYQCHHSTQFHRQRRQLPRGLTAF